MEKSDARSLYMLAGFLVFIYTMPFVVGMMSGNIIYDMQWLADLATVVLSGVMQGGVYAINVVARRHLKKGSVHLDGNDLHFSNTEKTLSIVNIIATTKRVEKEFRRITGKNIRVRSVIAVPGWDIKSQTSNEHLLVNERNLPMISGWKDQNDYLMNEDADALQKDLTGRCKLTSA